MSEKLTIRCYWCDGTGRMASIACLDCHGEKELCILCTKAPSDCECPPSRFDPIAQRRAIEGGQSY